jgi:phage-related protein
VWNNIVAFFNGSIGPKEFFSNIFRAAFTLIKSVFNALGAYFAGIWATVKMQFSGVEGFFIFTFKNAYNAIKNQFSNIGTYFGSLWGIIKEKFTGVGTMIGTAIGSAFKTVMNSVLATVENTINTAVRNINSAITIIRKIPGLSKLAYLSNVSIPRLANGGIVNTGQMFIAGEAGREAIVPLDRNTEWASAISDTLLSKMGGGMMGDTPLTIVLQVNETQLGKVTCNSINSLIKQNGVIPLNI